jgi:hypothetical protein
MRITGMKCTKLYRHLRRIRTAASRDAVIGLEQGGCHALGSRMPRLAAGGLPNPGFRMFGVVRREWEETGMHLQYLWARHPKIAGGNVHVVQAVSSRVALSRCRAARSVVLLDVLLQFPTRKRPLPARKGP